ncbi:MAG TPA: COR domain-containing protein [Pyrinomonadaceae bacterium]|nr:COR domain-containing protein [Pyrinomonadaceae bacterium]
MTKLPESIGQLKNIQELSFYGNRLTEVPESIGRLTLLQRLYLTDNRLTELPESIGRLTQLRGLYLNNNKLTNLPESLLNLKKLERLYLHGNKALGLPAEVLGPEWGEGGAPANPKEILEYYFRVRGGERRPLNEAKLILVGRGGVGKTSVVNRLIHKTFKDEKKTEGIKITEWSLTVGRKKDKVRLNVWDFGGQEIMHATHQFFLTERSLYLLVLSGREGGEDADAEYWLKLIQSFGGDSPVIVVLNKIKEHPFDVNRSALQQKYPFIREFIKTDCKAGTGVTELRRAVERETDRLEHLRDAFPAAWFSIKDKLAGMRKNYLSFDVYRKECAKLGEEDPKAQESLAFYLHSLGIALNYKDDPRLKDTHVLNPHWVTNGIYKILNANRLEKQKGEIKLRDLPDILDKRKYPKEMHGFLLELMKKFELCFDIPGKETEYLIPELLDKQEPPVAREFKPEECLNFEYQYPVLPEGLLPRFIVRTHVLSDDTRRWRTGVILKLEDNLALVKGDLQDRRVFINIKGPVAGRRRLLSIIRANFDRIHADIRRLQPEEIVPLPGRPGSSVSYKDLLAWEQNGMKKFPMIVDGSVTEIDVDALLNGVEVEAERAHGRAGDERGRAARIFVSYSHKDERLLNELKTHLSPLRRLGLMETWDDREIEAGEDWREKINENLERADVFILLVSASSIASDYCFEKEFGRALERHAKNELRIIPVIVRDSSWRKIPELAGLQAVPKDGRAVMSSANKDKTWREVSESIEKVLQGMSAADPIRRRAC